MPRARKASKYNLILIFELNLGTTHKSHLFHSISLTICEKNYKAPNLKWLPSANNQGEPYAKQKVSGETFSQSHTWPNTTCMSRVGTNPFENQCVRLWFPLTRIPLPWYQKGRFRSIRASTEELRTLSTSPLDQRCLQTKLFSPFIVLRNLVSSLPK